MTDLEKLQERRPDLVEILKQYSHEELLENYATEVLEKDEAEMYSKLNAVDFGWLSARVKEHVETVYGEDHSAIITSEKSTIIHNVQTYR
ncbi:hypothetical protein [Epilithonimonas xixisoli]|uniref:Uncharacterized protein n=1 Tax=Epilithonimonas xixisoli TaxID=1476462 RepID=A0A4R8IEW8_9FLAO|nr:hypothetical protein [Epilithonimonas xixisoli]TDX83944.1 hypothetical protein B0I22_1532 [Epilithonimonas xixisoli]